MFGKLFGKTSEDNVQEKVYQDYSKDGAMVASLGFLLAAIGLTVVFWSTIWNWLTPLEDIFGFITSLIPLAILMIPCLLMIRIWRLKITFPRLGYSKYILKRDLPRKWLPRYMLLLLVLDFVFMFVVDLSLRISASGEPVAEDLADTGTLAAIVVGTTLAVLGFHLGIPKAMMIAAPMLAFIWFASYISISYGWIFVIAGLLLMWIGYQRLREFLREFPLEVANYAG